jgi:hypothetical protein
MRVVHPSHCVIEAIKEDVTSGINGGSSKPDAVAKGVGFWPSRNEDS